MRGILIHFSLLLLVGIFSGAFSQQEEIEETEHEVLVRVARGAGHQPRNKGSPTGDCRYKKGPWQECDSATNTEQRTLTLKKGPSYCESVKVVSRKCKKACRYDKGDWQECNHETNMRVRVDTLKPKSDPSCDPTRTITKKCKKVCKYDRHADWSRCENGQKAKVMPLLQGSPDLCEPSRTITKPCHSRRPTKKQPPKVNPTEDDYED